MERWSECTLKSATKDYKNLIELSDLNIQIVLISGDFKLEKVIRFAGPSQSNIPILELSAGQVSSIKIVVVFTFPHPFPHKQYGENCILFV